MANQLMDSYRNLALGAGLNLSSLTIKPMLVDLADYTFSAAHDFLDDVASAARVPAIGSCPALASKTLGVVATGVFDAADPTFTALTGDQVEALFFVEDSGVAGTSDLLAYFDTATGLPLTPGGGDVILQLSASGIWKF